MKNILFMMLIVMLLGCVAPAVVPKESGPVDDGLPHAKMPSELLGMRVLDLKIGQSAWIGKYFVYIDEKHHIWVNPTADLSEESIACLKITRVASSCVELSLLRKNINSHPTIFLWTPCYISKDCWKVSKFTIEENEED